MAGRVDDRYLPSLPIIYLPIIFTKRERHRKILANEKDSTFKKKKKVKRNITSGIAYVYSTFNNTINSKFIKK